MQHLQLLGGNSYSMHCWMNTQTSIKSIKNSFVATYYIHQFTQRVELNVNKRVTPKIHNPAIRAI